jgi:hypothetical protein
MKKTLTNIFKIGAGLVSEPSSYLAFLYYTRGPLISFIIVSLMFLSSIWSSKILVHDIPRLQTQTNQAIHEFTNHYPSEVVINWTGQELLLTPQQTYPINYPSFIDYEELELPPRLAYYVPDVLAASELSNTLEYDAFFVLTPTKLFIQNRADDWSELPWAEFPQFTQAFSFTKDQLIGTLTQQGSDPRQWQTVAWLGVVISPLVVLASTLLSGVTQLVLAYLVVVKLYNQSLPFKALARLAIPLSVVAMMMQLIGELIYGTVPFPLFTTTFWIVLFLVVRSLPARKRYQQPKNASEQP